MKTALALIAAALAVATSAPSTRAAEMAAGTITGTVSLYTIATPDIGSCRLQGISPTSDNFKNYASVLARDATMNDGCARCIKVTRADDASKAVTAYVLDVAQGASTTALRLSQPALGALGVDVNSNNASVSYKFVTCPSAMASGNVKACLMEGASNAYIPLQFYNSQKVIASAKINGVEAKSSKDAFLFSATSGQSTEAASAWFANVAVELTSYDNETLSGSFAFGAASGCATYSTQFSAASTADGTDISAARQDAGGSGALLPALLGGVGALLLLIGSVFVVRRRRVARAGVATPSDGDARLSPKAAPAAAKRVPTDDDYDDFYRNNGTNNNGGGTQTQIDIDVQPRSPTIDYEQSFSPAASFGGAAVGSGAVAESPAHAAAASDHRSVSSGSGSARSYAKPPTYSFSSSVSTSPRRASRPQVSVPTFQAPVVPSYAAPAAFERPGSRSFSDDDDSDAHSSHGAGGRSSFDIDDMRSTEELKSAERGGSARFSAFGGAQHAPREYAGAAVTSPQSYVRATSLRRNTATRTPSAVYRSAGASASSETLDAGAPYAPGSGFREPSTGYSRDSLNILGYPYAKKSGRNGSITEAQF